MLKKVLITVIVGLFITSLVLAADYVAIVDGITINVKSFDLIYQDSLRDYNRYRTLSNQGELSVEEKNRLKNSVLDALIENTIIKNYAKKETIRISDQEIKEKINELQKGFQTKEDFWRALKEQDIKFDKLVQNIREEIVKDKVVKRVYPDFGRIITEDVIGYLKKNKLFMFPIQYNITLLVSNNYGYIEDLVKTDLEIADWKMLAVDKERSYQSLIVSEEDLPIQVAEQIGSINMKTFSKVKKYNNKEYFSVRINQIVNMPSFDINSISKSIRDALNEEKKLQYYNNWMKSQRDKSVIILNPDIFPEYKPNENDEEIYLERNIDVTDEEKIDEPARIML